MNPMDYYDTIDDFNLFSKMARMAKLIHDLVQAVEHLRKENEELKERVGNGGG